MNSNVVSKDECMVGEWNIRMNSSSSNSNDGDDNDGSTGERGSIVGDQRRDHAIAESYTFAMRKLCNVLKVSHRKILDKMRTKDKMAGKRKLNAINRNLENVPKRYVG